MDLISPRGRGAYRIRERPRRPTRDDDDATTTTTTTRRERDDANEKHFIRVARRLDSRRVASHRARHERSIIITHHRSSSRARGAIRRDTSIPSNRARDAIHPRARARTHRTHRNTHLDLGRLEGGDAADEGGSEERGHYRSLRVCWNDDRVAIARAGSIAPRTTSCGLVLVLYTQTGISYPRLWASRGVFVRACVVSISTEIGWGSRGTH